MNSRLQLSDLAQTNLSELDVVERYTRFAPVYNQSVTDWGYQCHRTAADALRHYVPTNQPILDVGCGTGLVGQALADLGYQNIIGVDISPDMLNLAQQAECYRKILRHDLTQLPYPFVNNSFTAVTCIGVFSLIADPIPVLHEFYRLVCPQGYLVFTQQEILYQQYGYADILKGFEQRGELRCESISEPVVYLPNREGYSDRKILYCIYQVTKDN